MSSASIQELRIALEAKKGATLATTSLADLNTLMDTLGAQRGNTLPADEGGYYSGKYCPSFVAGKFPYTGDLSLGDMNDYQVSWLRNCECDTRQRTTCSCQARTLCDCVGREAKAYSGTWCSCYNRTACNCNGRTHCNCNGRCNCNVEQYYNG